MRGKTTEVNCKNCGILFTARVADRKRGWGKYCDKSCKAKEQEARTGQQQNYFGRIDRQYMDSENEEF